MDVIEAIESRKSVRAFRPDPVPKEVLTKILEVALRAPSTDNTQPWEFIVAGGQVVQDIAKAKEILGRTATLEIMLVDEEHDLAAAMSGHVPPGSKLYKDRRGRPILLKKQVIYSGDNIVDAAAGFDSQGGGPVAHITLDARGAAINQRVTGENVGKMVVQLEE